ncbi:ATP synthase F1 subunit delta [Mycoplasmopsis phocirhinis]|uniref:ATP synthase subunit delta n=1 Tax=Mycoplasmopsis phocirhinis TaxID=142650 RepID=A0A4P6MP45_9BACT|nr:ATP synthase F1 subunit delta [Mycoplasmopsis phocirhinis]QBF34466.1 ATP synthase F1 subunit delta [Mycoplasmopsis phocirhinis]
MFVKSNIDAYAKAIFELASEQNNLAITIQTLQSILDACEQNQNFINFLSNPSISQNQKFLLIEHTFSDLIALETIINFLKILVIRRVFYLIKPIIKTFLKYANNSLGIKDATIYTAYELNQQRLDSFKNYLAKKYHCQINLKHIILPDLISGFRIEIDSDVIEHNLATDIDKLAKSILKTRSINE